MIEFAEAGYGYGAHVVLRDVSLTLAPGSLTFLLGPSGAGKTTFLRLCHLDLAPDRGAVRLFGRDAPVRDRDAVADLRRRIGFVRQHVRFLDHLGLRDNVALPLRAAGVEAAGRAGDLAALLDWVGLGARGDAPPGALSGDERRRAALARAVILSPEAILVDEPAGAVDREAASRFVALLVELNRMGMTVVIATHDGDLARAAAARAGAAVLGLADGRAGPAEGIAA